MNPGASKPVALPERIGRYRIIRPLSKGGMALVYEGRRDSMAGISTKVAIKVILPNYAKSEAFKELFINEARLGAAMQHQNLVQIQDFDAEDDQYFLVMEYVEGLTLSRVVGLAARHDLRIP
ncbi:MAG: protein kinase, partial [Myxococcota bacterium]